MTIEARINARAVARLEGLRLPSYVDRQRQLERIAKELGRDQIKDLYFTAIRLDNAGSFMEAI